MERVLDPGAWFFGRAPLRLSTLLGSCVALSLWHPGLRQGGMCHYLLPGAGKIKGNGQADSRYAEAAFALLQQAVTRHGTRLHDYELGLFGGGNMFPDGGVVFGGRVGQLNIEAAQRFLRQQGLRLRHQEVGGSGYHKVALDVASGRVEHRFVALPLAPEQCRHCRQERCCYGGCARQAANGRGEAKSWT